MNLFDEFRKIAASDIKPFHDDAKLQSFILSAIKMYKIHTFFETGTFRGDSLKWVAERMQKMECYSVESKKIYYLYAKMNVRLPNITIIQGDSRKTLYERLELLWTPALFWLDAHWDDDFPLPDELSIISGWGKRAIIIIDDFKHPTRPLGYDSYNGRDIDIEIVKKNSPNVKAYVPSYDAPRGYAVLFQKLEPETELVKDLERIY